MQRARSLTKYFALSRCPPPAFLELLGMNAEPNPGNSYVQANLANRCRQLYTELPATDGPLIDIRKALLSRRRTNNMSWVKLTCGLSKREAPKTIGDLVNMPLKECCDLTPCHIGYGKHVLCSRKSEVDMKENSNAQTSSPDITDLEPGLNNLSYGEEHTICGNYTRHLAAPDSVLGTVKPKVQPKGRKIRMRGVRSLNLRVTVKPDTKVNLPGLN